MPFIGWGENYDVWRNLGCPSILPPGSASHFYIHVDIKSFTPQNIVEDFKDAYSLSR
jgi:hypothetical protein